MGGFGGYTGRALVVGDTLVPGVPDGPPTRSPCREDVRPQLVHEWEVAVQEGPQPAPSYFTPADMEMFYDATWQVQTHANRTGIRLTGPKPQWARPDGGEAGLHPSNLHDNPYSVGALNVSGDTPILLGPDGPSLGGFACPLTVVVGHRWKMGQIRPGDTVRLVPVPDATADALRTDDALRASAHLGAGRAHRPRRRRRRARAGRGRRPTWSTCAAATTTCSSSTARWCSTSACGCGCTPWARR